MAYTTDLKSVGESLAGSTPASRTAGKRLKQSLSGAFSFGKKVESPGGEGLRARGGCGYRRGRKGPHPSLTRQCKHFSSNPPRKGRLPARQSSRPKSRPTGRIEDSSGAPGKAADAKRYVLDARRRRGSVAPCSAGAASGAPTEEERGGGTRTRRMGCRPYSLLPGLFLFPVPCFLFPLQAQPASRLRLDAWPVPCSLIRPLQFRGYDLF